MPMSAVRANTTSPWAPAVPRWRSITWCRVVSVPTALPASLSARNARWRSVTIFPAGARTAGLLQWYSNQDNRLSLAGGPSKSSANWRQERPEPCKWPGRFVLTKIGLYLYVCKGSWSIGIIGRMEAQHLDEIQFNQSADATGPGQCAGAGGDEPGSGQCGHLRHAAGQSWSCAERGPARAHSGGTSRRYRPVDGAHPAA